MRGQYTRNPRRRTLLQGLFASVLVPTTLLAQPRMDLPRIGMLMTYAFEPNFVAMMRELGYVEGVNARFISPSSSARNIDVIPQLIAEVLRADPQVLVVSNLAAANAALRMTSTLPIVIISSVDPVEAGYAVSLSRPGRNVTGVASLQRDLSAKRLQLFREFLPNLTTLGMLWDAGGPGPKVAIRHYEAAATVQKIRIVSFPVSAPKPDLVSAFAGMRAGRVDGLIVIGNPTLSGYAKEIADLALQARVPTLAERVEYAAAGALVSFGADETEQVQQLARFTHRILGGARPADLPFEQSTKFQIVLNKQTAKVLGIKVPQEVLLRADRVIS